MRVAGLFAGIGGFELGFARAGHEAALFCEILPTAVQVLRDRFPGVPIHSDVVQLKSLPADIELITAGFPCQDLSQAGRTAGLAGHRSGLIGEVFRLVEKRVRARRPIPWIVLENVPFMLQLNGGEAIRAITAELERLKYRWAYRVVDTLSFGLPQRRERVYIVASALQNPADVLLADDKPLQRPETDLPRYAHGFYWTEGFSGLGWAVDAIPTLKNGSTIGIPSAPAILLPNGRIVKPGIQTCERLQGFNGDWTKPAEKVGRASLRWSLVGNAVTVAVSEWLGKRIARPGTYDRMHDRPLASSGRMPRSARYDGGSRFEVAVSPDPIGLRAPHLSDFMGTDYSLLSMKATAGFLGRARRAKLRFPNGFLEAVDRHLQGMTSASEEFATEQLVPA